MQRLGIKTVLVTGASGKLGRAIASAYVEAGYTVRALQHRTPVEIDGVEAFVGNVSDPDAMLAAVDGMDAVCQLATTKEDKASFFDVSVRGTLNLLEAARASGRVKQFLLSGGDAAMGIWFHPQPIPINETMPLGAYPGYYAFTKVIEEVMCQQYMIQYGLPYTCLRASWVFTGDDILKHLSLTRAVDPDRGTPSAWDEYLTDEQRALVAKGEDRVPIACTEAGVPLRRHIVQLEDVVQSWLLALDNPAAVGQTFHIAAPSAFSYGVAARYLSERTGTPTTELTLPGCYPFEIDITKARSVLGYRPQYDIQAIIDAALALEGGC
jgi:UDP-glucose 4-epimerase